METLTQPSTANNSLLRIIFTILFIALPFLGFFLGMQYQNLVTEPTAESTQVPTTLIRKLTPTPHLSNQPYPTLSNNQNSMTSQVPTGALANWKTYENSDLGFSIKYPSSVKVEKESNDQYNKFVLFKGDNLEYEVMLRKNPGTITLDTYYYMDNTIARKTTLVGKVANVYESSSSSSCLACGNYVSVVTEKGSYLYHITFNGDNKLSEVENQILSTFKFTQ